MHTYLFIFEYICWYVLIVVGMYWYVLICVHICLYCYPFGSSADPFSQDPLLAARGALVLRPFYLGTIPNWSEMKQNKVRNRSKRESKASQNRSKIGKGGARRALEKLVPNKTLHRRKRPCICLTKLRICADLGWHLGTRWILKGSPNLTFLQKANIKLKKVRSRSVSQKNMKIWWEINAKRWLLGRLNVAKVPYCCSKTSFSQFENIYEKWSQKGCQKSS